MDVSILKKIGLNDKEIKVYLGLLEFRAISVRSLADAVDLNRGTVYDILKKLQDYGLASFYNQDTKQKFVAEEPEKLLHLISAQENELARTKNKIAEIIPELKSTQDKGGSRPVLKIYEKKIGIRAILEDVLRSTKKDKQEYCVYSATETSNDINQAYPDFTKDRIKQGIKVRAISMAKGGQTHGLDERRWLGTNDKSATFILIYAGKCAFISRDARGAPVGVIIENQMIYQTQKIIFNQLWSLLQ